MATVTITNLHKRFGTTPVLTGIDLSIADGEFVVLVGPSGCGKSTLLRCIAGLEQPSAGAIAIGGRDVTALPPKARDIAMVFQSYALYPHLRVRENIGFSLKLRGAAATEIEARVTEAAALLGLEELLDRYPRELSGGQRQRVAMGRAIVRRPAVFLFDEPLSNLDAAMRLQMRTELAELHQRLGATMIYVTHDQVEAMTLADRVVVLHQGLLQQVAPPLELYRHPQNVFVARFIGSPAMNLFALAAGASDSPLGALPEALARASAERPLLVGLRPEHAAPTTAGAPGGPLGTVAVVEPLGFEALVHLRFAGQTDTVVCRVAASDLGALRPGDRVGLAYNADQLHCFDAETGRAH